MSWAAPPGTEPQEVCSRLMAMKVPAVGRSMAWHAYMLAAAGAVAVMCTACGSQGGAKAASPAGPSTSLAIMFTAGPEATPQRWTLTCRPVGGTLPHARAACAALGAAHDPFAPVPRGVMCSQIDFGPQKVTVTGYWQGQRVSAHFSRVNSCQDERWKKVAALFSLPS